MDLTYTKYIGPQGYLNTHYICGTTNSIGLYTHSTWCATDLIYLEPIVNSSLRLDENAERTLQLKANEGFLVKEAKSHLLVCIAGQTSACHIAGGWDSKH